MKTPARGKLELRPLTCWRAPRRLQYRPGSLAVLGALIASGPEAHARVAEVSVSSDQPLRFGTLLVPSAGSRAISARGMVTDIGLFAVGGDPVGPAQFTVTYDRGNESRRAIDIELEVFLSGNQAIRIGGVAGQLSDLNTDLPGAERAMNAGPYRLTIGNCMERRCSISFKVGGKISLSRSAGGGSVIVPLSASATVLKID